MMYTACNAALAIAVADQNEDPCGVNVWKKFLWQSPLLTVTHWPTFCAENSTCRLYSIDRGWLLGNC